MDYPYQLVKYNYDEDEIENANKSLKKSLLASKSILKITPIIGPILSPIIDYIDGVGNIKESENLKKCFEQLYDKIHELEISLKLIDKIGESQQREIYFIFKKFVSAVYNQPDLEYIDYLTTYLTNCLNVDYSEDKMKVSILNKIAKYTKQHIEILSLLYIDFVEHNGLHKINIDNNNVKLQMERMKHIDIVTINCCLCELKSDGLIYQHISAFSWSSFSPYLITELGIRSLEMIGMIK